MPWQSDNLKILINKAIDLNFEFFKEIDLKKITIPVFICTVNEMEEAVVEEALLQNKNRNSINRLKKLIPRMYGKYFDASKKIYVIEGKGERIETIIHEFLHSIQNCMSKREGIVRFLAFKITDNQKVITDFDLNDWQEIEKSVGLKTIKLQLLARKNCEDF